MGVPNPSQPAKKVNGTSTASVALTTSTTASSLVYSRRYLDWNRRTFEYHAAGSQVGAFETVKGLDVSANITATRHDLNLTSLYGCAPQTWCISCAPFLSNGSIFTLLTEALSATIINETRADNARIIILNTGSVRFDLIQGPFTYDDSFIVSPFTDAFQYISDVPYDLAETVLPALNGGAPEKRSAASALSARDFGFYNPSQPDACVDPPTLPGTHGNLHKRTQGRVVRRQAVITTPGCTYTDGFNPRRHASPEHNGSGALRYRHRTRCIPLLQSRERVWPLCLRHLLTKATIAFRHHDRRLRHRRRRHGTQQDPVLQHAERLPGERVIPD